MTDSIFHTWHSSAVWQTTKYKGVLCQQSPCDLWSLQEIAHETKPEIVVMTGLAAGGTALYMTDLVPYVIGIDVLECPVHHPRLGTIQGSSTDETNFNLIRKLVDGRRCMVVLDSDHTANHVHKELILYSPLVTTGCYLLVEDTSVGKLCCLNFGPGPAEALAEWLPSHPEFEVDHLRTRWGLSQHPGGYLKRIKT